MEYRTSSQKMAWKAWGVSYDERQGKFRIMEKGFEGNLLIARSNPAKEGEVRRKGAREMSVWKNLSGGRLRKLLLRRKSEKDAVSTRGGVRKVREPTGDLIAHRYKNGKFRDHLPGKT